MEITPSTTERRYRGGMGLAGAAAAIMLVTGCSSTGAAEHKATDAYVASHDVPTGCEQNLRDLVKSDTQARELQALADRACPEVPSATAFQVAADVQAEVDAPMSDNALYIGFGAAGGLAFLMGIACAIVGNNPKS